MNTPLLGILILAGLLIAVILLVNGLLDRIPYEPGMETIEDRLRNLYEDHVWEMRREGFSPLEYAEWKAKYQEMLGEIEDE